MRNNFKTTIALRRIDICDLMIACTAAKSASGADKWDRLHGELKRQLDELDRQLDEIENK